MRDLSPKQGKELEGKKGTRRVAGNLGGAEGGNGPPRKEELGRV